jgi:S1-C subfamily serine protease
MPVYLPFLVVASAFLACSFPEQHDLRGSSALPVVYDEDDRIPPSMLPTVTREAVEDLTFALVPDEFVETSSEGRRLRGPTAGEVFGLCESEPFAGLEAAAVCTGILVDDDILATAGHCIENESTCRKLVFLRRYVEDAVSRDLLDDNDVFRCEALLFRERAGSTGVDLALVRFDRAATHGTLLRSTAHVGETVVACGANFGTRVTCDPRAQVVGSSGSVVTLVADMAIGASGGPVLDHKGRLLGMLYDGAADFAPSTGCVTEAIRTNPGKERAMTIASVDATLCRLTGEDACEGPVPGGACEAGRPRSLSRGDLALAMFVFLLLFRVKSTRSAVREAAGPGGQILLHR